MNTRRTILILLFLVLAANASAREIGWCPNRLRCGIEWGYTATVFEGHVFGYVSDMGARVESEGSSLIYNSNGHFICYAGMEMGKRFETDLVSGYIGIVQGRRVMPLTLRETFFFKGCRKDGFKIFADGGLCFTGSFRHQQNWIAKTGVGYRMMLGDKPAMDFSLSVHGAYDHPSSVYISEYSYPVPIQDLRKSDRQSVGIDLSIALSF